MLNSRSFLSLATQRSVVVRATKISLIVGVILFVINQGDLLISGAKINWWKAVLTFAVPYCVSTYSSVAAMRDNKKKPPGTSG